MFPAILKESGIEGGALWKSRGEASHRLGQSLFNVTDIGLGLHEEWVICLSSVSESSPHLSRID